MLRVHAAYVMNTTTARPLWNPRTTLAPAR